MERVLNINIIMKIIIVFFSIIVFTACNTTQNTNNSDNPTSNAMQSEDNQGESSKIDGITAKNYPIVDGSTATMPLMAAAYSEIIGVPLEEAETFVEVSTTAPSWRNLLNYNVNLLIVYEAPETVKQEIKDSNVELEVTPLGRDGLVFLANTENKANNLTQDQIKDIYTGKITNWSSVGGNNEEIIPFQRDKESGSQTLFEKLLLKGTKPMDAPTELRPADMGALIDGVAYYDGSGGAIGYSVFYYAKEMYTKPNLKLLEVDGVAPSVETIGSGKYPLVNDFYVAIRKDEPADSPTRLLYNWLISKEGAELVKKTGYAPITK